MSCVTVTLNVAIDQTVRLGLLERGIVHRALSVDYNAGGKGVNVASCLADWGTTITATGFLGSENAATFESLCTEKNISDEFVRVPGSSRVNIKLVDIGETTDINLPGVSVTQQNIDCLYETLEKLSANPDVIVLAGSLPVGCDDDIYAKLLPQLTKAGWKVVLDASEKPLQVALESETLPYCIKPNNFELSEWFGKTIETEEEILNAGKALHKKGITLVVISLGEGGAYFISDQGVIKAKTIAQSIVSTVGAGDAMVAGITAAISEGGNLERIARLSTAFSVGKLSLLGPNLPAKDKVEYIAKNVTIEKF